VIESLASTPLGLTLFVFPLFSIGMILYAAIRTRLGDYHWLNLFPPLWFGLTIWLVLIAEVGVNNLREIFSPWMAVNLGVAIGTALAPLVALVSYFFELWLSTKSIEIRNSRTFSGGFVPAYIPGLGGSSEVPIPRINPSESFRIVQKLSASPGLFAFISIFTAVGEEFLYRGFLTDNLLGLWGAPVLVIATSSALYGFNHIPFGLPAFLGKFVAGCLFAGLALLGDGSIVACLVAHLLLQVLVFRRLRK
jgi:hypothetical protein